MKLSSNDGIMCDLCGLGCRHEFTYYSYDFRDTEVHANRRQSLDSIRTSLIISSLDVCSLCFAKHRELIITNYGKIVSPTRRVLVGVMCDLSGKLMVGTYRFYYIDVTKVDVRGAGKNASVTTDKRHVEIKASEDMYKQLIEKTGTVRKEAGKWVGS